jgi:hypothetical protein
VSGFDSYGRSLSKLVTHERSAEKSLRAIIEWYESRGKSEFVAAFEHETGLRLEAVSRSDAALLEHAFPKKLMN